MASSIMPSDSFTLFSARLKSRKAGRKLRHRFPARSPKAVDRHALIHNELAYGECDRALKAALAVKLQRGVELHG
jgi:hypothetical protein